MSMLSLLVQGDAVGRAVALVLLLMSISSWVVMLRKGWLLRRGTRDVLRSIAAFWQSASLDDAVARLRGFDRTRLVLPSIEALHALVPAAGAELGADAAGRATLAATGTADARTTRALRDALHDVLRRLHAGQILLATVGATAPFVGLLGTVWGIHRALAGIAHEGTLAIDKVAGPVGEALV
ncbi:MAG: MotA/TolQ/ExbB proton channel family protein, partial [Comamonadaceae bacterium]